MKIQRLVQRANDVAAFFQSERNQARAVARIADHLQQFWESPRRQQLMEYVQSAEETGLCDLAEKAVRKLMKNGKR